MQLLLSSHRRSLSKKVLLMTLQNAPPGLDYERDNKFSKSFKEMIASCLVKDPTKRSSAKTLLKNYYFKQARSNDYISRTLLQGLLVLGDRISRFQTKVTALSKKMPAAAAKNGALSHPKKENDSSDSSDSDTESDEEDDITSDFML